MSIITQIRAEGTKISQISPADITAPNQRELQKKTLQLSLKILGALSEQLKIKLEMSQNDVELVKNIARATEGTVKFKTDLIAAVENEEEYIKTAQDECSEVTRLAQDKLKEFPSTQKQSGLFGFFSKN